MPPLPSISRLLLDIDDLMPVVVAAGSADTVGQTGRAAVGARYDAGSFQFPVRVTSLIPSGFGCFSLWNRHCNTSYLAVQQLLFILLIQKLLKYS